MSFKEHFDKALQLEGTITKFQEEIDVLTKEIANEEEMSLYDVDLLMSLEDKRQRLAKLEVAKKNVMDRVLSELQNEFTLARQENDHDCQVARNKVYEKYNQGIAKLANELRKLTELTKEEFGKEVAPSRKDYGELSKMQSRLRHSIGNEAIVKFSTNLPLSFDDVALREINRLY
jgi:hypothetical protein